MSADIPQTDMSVQPTSTTGAEVVATRGGSVYPAEDGTAIDGSKVGNE